MFATGAVAQAYAGKEIERRLRETEVAEKARKQRSATKRSSLQRGGVLYAAKARLMVKQREIDHIAAARALLNREAEKEAKRQETEHTIFLTSIRVRAKTRLALLRKKKLLDVDLHARRIYKVQ